MTPEQYDHWYASGRGRWIGEIEFRLLVSELDCQPGDKVLDVGCGTACYGAKRDAAAIRVLIKGRTGTRVTNFATCSLRFRLKTSISKPRSGFQREA